MRGWKGGKEDRMEERRKKEREEERERERDRERGNRNQTKYHKTPTDRKDGGNWEALLV